MPLHPDLVRSIKSARERLEERYEHEKENLIGRLSKELRLSPEQVERIYNGEDDE